MSALLHDSFDVSSLGRQHSSRRKTEAAFSFGTSNRSQHQAKVFISDKHERHKCLMTSPGPVYSVPTSVGEGPKNGFGTSLRPKFKAPYPDPSVDLICAEVDGQHMKFHNPTSTHFGTEPRDNPKNAEIIRTHPSSALGVGSPGACQYTPSDEHTAAKSPRFTFGHKTKQLAAASSQTPRQVGPGSYPTPRALGPQPSSARGTAPSFSFGGEQRMRAKREEPKLLDAVDDASAFGRQVGSRRANAPRAGFGSATRDHVDKTHLVRTSEDRGAAAHMPPIRFPHPPC